MAHADVAAPARSDWALANPWTWGVAGLVAAGLALGCVRLFGEDYSGARFVLVLFALLAASGSVALRLGSGRGAFLDALTPGRRSTALLVVAAGSGALVVAATALLLAALANLDMPWELSGVLWLWALAFPAGAAMWLYFLQRNQTGRPVSPAAEAATLLVLAAVTAFLCCWALYVDEAHARDWDSIRFFLAVVAAVAFLAAPLVLLPTRLRRLAVSALILFHFGGIATAALAPQPASWVIDELYGRLYRPYLQFMYLTNAYHFYAPDPGPSSYLWCWVEYEGPQGPHYFRWIKVPEMDDHGRPAYPAALAYQRHIALTDNSRGFNAAPPLLTTDQYGRTVPDPIYYWRLVNSPSPPERVFGKFAPKATLVVPFHVNVTPWPSQYQPINGYGKRMNSSFAVHICSLRDPTSPDDRAVSVKMYRVVHWIPPPGPLPTNYNPADPTMFMPYYQGKYDPKGNLLDEPIFENGELKRGDPFLYWLLPVITQATNDPWQRQPAIYSWVRKHAGDDHWYRPSGSTDWVQHPSPYEGERGGPVIGPRLPQ